MLNEIPSYIGSLTTVWSSDAYELTTQTGGLMGQYTTVIHNLFHNLTRTHITTSYLILTLKTNHYTRVIRQCV